MSETDMKKLFDKAIGIILDQRNMQILNDIATYSKPLKEENLDIAINEKDKFAIVDIGVETTDSDKVKESLENLIGNVSGLIKNKTTEQEKPVEINDMPSAVKDIVSSAMGSLGFMLPKLRDEKFKNLIQYVFTQKENVQYKVAKDTMEANKVHFKIKVTFKNNTDMNKISNGLQKVMSTMMQVYNMALQQ